MTAKELLEINCDFKKSPLIESLRRIHTLFNKNSVEYAVIGGMAVVRNGAVRTTDDIDVLTNEDGWKKIIEENTPGFNTGLDHAVDTINGIDIDILFTGNKWEMVIPVPMVDDIKEFDDELGAWFIDLLHLIELKTAVYMKKKSEDGIEVAAKDLADIVALTKNNEIDECFIQKLNQKVRSEFRGIWNRVK